MKNPNLDGKLDPLKPALSHIGLYLSLAAYTAIGAKVSHFLFLSYNLYLAQHCDKKTTQPSHQFKLRLDSTST